MDFQVQALPVPAISTAVPRRSANFHPSIWGDHFLANASDVNETISTQEKREHQLLKEEVKRMLIETPDQSCQKLDLIDSIRRLVVSYHFQSQIKASLQYLFDSFHKFNDEYSNNLHAVALAFRLLRQQARSYFQEAKWFYHGYVPTMEEYLKTALVTGAYMMLATISLVGMGDSVVKKEAFDWITNEPLMLGASSVINRLSDGMVGHEFEQERGHVASALDCYMNEHGASKQEAIDEFQKQITNAWKDINKECLDQPLVPMPVLERVLNLTRVINLVYKDEDGYTHSTNRIKDLITLVLVDPLSL